MRTIKKAYVFTDLNHDKNTYKTLVEIKNLNISYDDSDDWKDRLYDTRWRMNEAFAELFGQECVFVFDFELNEGDWEQEK